MASEYKAGIDFKIVVVGAGGVGKSALTVRFIQGNFLDKYDPTIEDSYKKTCEIDGVACMLDILDTAGQEEYSALRDAYMKTGEGFIIVYDITEALSLETVTELRQKILRTKGAADVPIMLVGNKCDLGDKRVILKTKGEELAAEFKCGFLEASAKNNTNVRETFEQLVREINKFNEKAAPKPGGGGSASAAGGAAAAGKKEKKGGCILL